MFSPCNPRTGLAFITKLQATLASRLRVIDKKHHPVIAIRSFPGGESGHPLTENITRENSRAVMFLRCKHAVIGTTHAKTARICEATDKSVPWSPPDCEQISSVSLALRWADISVEPKNANATARSKLGFTIDFRWNWWWWKREICLYTDYGTSRTLLARATRARSDSRRLFISVNGDNIATLLLPRSERCGSSEPREFILETHKGDMHATSHVLEWQISQHDYTKTSRRKSLFWTLRLVQDMDQRNQENSGRKRPKNHVNHCDVEIATWSSEKSPSDTLGTLSFPHGRGCSYYDKTWLKVHLISVAWIWQMM